MERETATTFTEAENVSPVYCSGLATVLVDEGNVHMAFYQEQKLGDGTTERIIVLRIIMPLAGVVEGRGLVDFELAAEKHRQRAASGSNALS